MNIKLLSERIKEVRTRAKETQAEFSKSINIDQKTISRFENGVQFPNCQTLITIATKYEVSTDWLLGGPEKTDTHDLQDHVAELEIKEKELIERIKELQANNETFRLALETITKMNRINDDRTGETG